MKKNEFQSQISNELYVPKTLGIIMDGNRRYATTQNLPKIQGHTAGYKKMLEVCQWSRNAGVQTLIVYAFSTENWNREKEELDSLTGLFTKILKTKNLRRKDTRVKIIGQKNRFSREVQKSISDIEKETQTNGPYTLIIALSYGGHAEIVSAVNTILKKGVKEITEKDIEKEMWAGDIVPDMILRTGGEQRLSNFLPWQSVYSELFFIKTLWPALTQLEFSDILIEYGRRKRNFGK